MSMIPDLHPIQIAALAYIALVALMFVADYISDRFGKDVRSHDTATRYLDAAKKEARERQKPT